MNMTPLEEIRHSCSHVLATAVLRLFPDTQLDIGPPTDSGFYYDFEFAQDISDKDFLNNREHLGEVIEKIDASLYGLFANE